MHAQRLAEQADSQDGDGATGDGDGAALAGTRGRSRKPIPPKLYRVGEVVEYSGLSRQTIHNYTTMGLLHESRWTAGGHRLYDDSVFARLDRIAELRASGRSIDEIRDAMAVDPVGN